MLAVSASLGLPCHLVTGDVRQANYFSQRAELVEFRRRVQQLQHGVIAHQLCRPVWARWLETAQLAGRLDLADPAGARMVQWNPPRWDWVDPLKDIHAQVQAMEAGITSRRKLGRLRNDAEATFEFHLFNGIQGVVKDPRDGATVIDYHTEFGITQATEVDFELDNATPGSGALRKRCEAMIECVEDTLGAHDVTLDLERLDSITSIPLLEIWR